MSNKEMKTLAFGDVTYEIVDEKARQELSEKGKPNGVATLDKTGKVPEEQLPEFSTPPDWNQEVSSAKDYIKNKPPIENGDGEKALVIGDGKAIGKYAVAGGTNDSSLVKDIVGTLGSLTSIDTPTAYKDMSLSFGAGTKALSVGTIAIGANTSAGCKGFYFWGIDFNTKVITLSTNQKPIILGSRKWTDEAKTQLGNWAVDDIISIVNDSKYVLCSKITAIDTTAGTITVDTLPFTEVKTQTLPNFDDYAVTCPSKPEVGVVDKGLGAFVIGLENKASGSFSHVEGWNNLGAGDFSHVEGSKNKAGYCSHAEGRDNEASGQISHAEGSYTVASGTSSHAEGSYTESSGDNSHAEGWGTEARGNQAHSEGAKTRAVGARCHTEGHYSIALGTDAHAEGWSTTLLEDIPIDLSIATNEEIIAQWESTKFNLAKGLRSHVEGANCLALEKYAHAEGSCTIASANQAHSEGNTTKASGSAAHSEGCSTKAIGGNSHAEGYQTEASGEASHAEGRKTTASGDYSHSEGNSTTASGDYSHAEGNSTTASGSYSHAEGIVTKASGSYSHAEGRITTASGINSHAEGGSTTASGSYSHAEGLLTTAGGDYQHVQGKYNVKDTKNNYAHIVGGGTSDIPLNLHTIRWSDGQGFFKGGTTSEGADYAEFFEWQDGNTDNEDRVGLLVTLDGEKIKLANNDDEILGIISGTAAVLGDNYECEWNGKYLTDDFGRVIYDLVEEFIDVEHIEFKEVEKEVIDEETNETRIETELEEVKTTEKQSLGFWKHPRLNPDYDPEQKYINRLDRPEWDTVGMLGKLFVRDDGTCEVNGYTTVGENGIATASSEKTNMRVLSRVNENVVRVLLK